MGSYKPIKIMYIWDTIGSVAIYYTETDHTNNYEHSNSVNKTCLEFESREASSFKTNSQILRTLTFLA